MMSVLSRVARFLTRGGPIVVLLVVLSQEMGIDWSIREGYAWVEDKEHCEEYGRMLQADPTKASKGPHRQSCDERQEGGRF